MINVFNIHYMWIHYQVLAYCLLFYIRICSICEWRDLQLIQWCCFCLLYWSDDSSLSLSFCTIFVLQWCVDAPGATVLLNVGAKYVAIIIPTCIWSWPMINYKWSTGRIWSEGWSKFWEPLAYKVQWTVRVGLIELTLWTLNADFSALILNLLWVIPVWIYMLVITTQIIDWFHVAISLYANW